MGRITWYAFKKEKKQKKKKQKNKNKNTDVNAWRASQPHGGGEAYLQELLLKQSPCESQIELDLSRTFPTHELFAPGERGLAELRTVLLAYAIHNPTIGYCQGMSYLAATLLIR